MTQIKVALTDEQMAVLEGLARERHVSPGELVQEEAASLLRSAGGRRDDERRRRALTVAGRFRSGRGDLARHHDDHLAEDPRE